MLLKELATAIIREGAQPRISKHIDVQYHFNALKMELWIWNIATKEMVANGLTKALPKEKHWI